MKFLLTLLVAIAPVFSFAVTANEIWEDMNSKSKKDALRYIQGVADAANEKEFCAPSGVSYGQLYDIIENDFRRFPEFRHLRASDLIVLSLKNRFPCADRF